MPEYLAPGVYVEETSFRSKSIEGVATTTTGFIGPTRYGPIDIEPDVITSVGEFERVYGDRQQLLYGHSYMNNYVWHAVRAFFEEGGKRLYIVRTFKPLLGVDPDPAKAVYKRPAAMLSEDRPTQNGSLYNDGHARSWRPNPPPAPGSIQGLVQIRARFPGDSGNLHVRLTLRLGQNVLSGDPIPNSTALKPKVGALQDGDLVWINTTTSPVSSPPGSGVLYLAESYFDTTNKEWTWRFINPDLDSPPSSPLSGSLRLSQLTPSLTRGQGDQVRVVTLMVTVLQPDGSSLVWNGLPLDPNHERSGTPDSFAALFAQDPSNIDLARSLPIVMTLAPDLDSGLKVVHALFSPAIIAGLSDPKASDLDLSVDVPLAGGNDGQRPTANAYEGTAEQDQTTKTGLKAFEDIDDIAIIAAPGSTFNYENGGDQQRAESNTIISLLIAHAELLRYRIAVLDSGDGQSIAQVRALRARFDSNYAALYYPWVRVLDPVTDTEIYLPPSGFVAGIYARNDINRAVYKAPANEVVNLAIGFEHLLNKSQQEVLNPEGINCFRFFEGRGFRLWGARTISSDPEWKYVNLRRYFIYLEHSIDKGTQFAVFEPNGPALWANVRRTIEDFLLNEWQSGALLGDKPEKAYFVRCDRSTMTQNDLDNGRLVCLIGVAPLRPAEFVIFRIGQFTADAKA
jgi:phage tail sheath protein FI